jgi:hypothetical protein
MGYRRRSEGSFAARHNSSAASSGDGAFVGEHGLLHLPIRRGGRPGATGHHTGFAIDRSVDVARLDGLNSDAKGFQFVPERFGEPFHRVLAGVVRPEEREDEPPAQRGDVDDEPVTPRAHPRHQGHSLEQPANGVDAGVFDAAEKQRGGIVDQHIRHAPLGQQGFRERRDGIRSGQIEQSEFHAGGPFRGRLATEVANGPHHVPSIPGEAQGRGLAQARRDPGHHYERHGSHLPIPAYHICMSCLAQASIAASGLGYGEGKTCISV